MTDLFDLVGLDADDPAQLRANLLVQSDYDMLRQLIESRVRAGLSQREVGRRMGVSQPTVAAFETVGNDPKLSTIRRYAQAVSACITHKVAWHEEKGATAESGTTQHALKLSHIPTQPLRESRLPVVTFHAGR